MYTNLTPDKAERLPYSDIIREICVNAGTWVQIMKDRRDNTCRVYVFEKGQYLQDGDKKYY